MRKLFSSLILVFTSIFALTPKEGEKLAKIQSFTYNAGAAITSLDPAKAEGIQESYTIRSLFETLTISDENDKIIPGVAYRWESSKDNKTWTFYLRKDAKWSNGDPVTAHDFVYAWRRLSDPKTGSASATHLTYMKLKNTQSIIDGKLPKEELGVVAKDDYTLVLNLEEGVPFVDVLVEMFTLSPVPSKVIEKLGDAWSDPKNLVGNGAFKIDSLVVNKDAKLSKNPHYWDAKNVILQNLTFLQTPSESVAFTRYRSGDLDSTSFPIELFEKVKKEYASELITGPALCTYSYDFNHSVPPFDNANIRRALSISIDREVIVKNILAQGQLSAYNLVPPNATSADSITPPEWSKWDDKKRYEEAKKLLLEAGYSKAKPLQFTLLYNTNDTHKKLAIAVGAMWKKNLDGLVNVKLQNQELKVFLSNKRLGSYEVARGGVCASYNEASSFLNTYLSTSANNQPHFKNPSYDAALDSAYKASSKQDRASKYALAEKILYEDSAIAPVYFFNATELVKPYVKGYKIKASKSYYFKNLYILEH